MKIFKGHNKIIGLGVVLLIIISVSTVLFVTKKNSENKAIQTQIALQAQKEENNKAKEQLKLQEEQKKQEELAKLQEQKKQEEQKKLEEQAKQVDAVKGIGKSRKIPVLMYHSIDYEKNNELRIPKEKFREQMQYLKDNGFTPLSLEGLYSHMVLNTNIPNKPIVITLDDGYVDNYTNAFPVLKEFGFKATVFVITNTVDVEKSYLSSEHIKEMDANGIEIESHTVSHPKLDELSYDEQTKEMRDSKVYLEKLLNREVKYIAYPYGKYNDNTLKAVQELGYKMAFSTRGGLAEKSNGIYKLHRIYVSNKHNMEQFKNFVNMK